MIKYNSNTVSKWYDGASNAKKMYYGNKLMFLEYLIPPSYKLVAQYNDTTEYKVTCNEDTTLSTTDTRGHTTPISAMTSAVVNGGGCVTQIGMNAFSGATSLTSLTLSDGITTFNNQAFIEMHSLESFTFPSTLTTFGGSVFRFSNIKKFNNKIPSGVTYLQSGALADMYKLTGMTIPATITSSSTNLFLRDSGLTEVHFEGTTPPALGANAFKDCTALIKIYIPSCDCYDAYAADSQFSGLTNLIYAEDGTSCYTPPMNFKMKRYFIDGRSNEIACNSSSAVTSADTRSGYTVAQLTASTSGLCEVIIGDCVEGISANSFNSMTRLSAVTISDNVKHIGASAFTIGNVGSNNRLHDIDLGNGVQTISQYAFLYAGYVYASNYVTEIKIPKSVTYIGNRAFSQAKMKKLVLNTTTATTIDKYAFYLSTGNSISIDFVVNTLGEYAFNGFSGLINVKVSGVTTLNSNGRQFYNCGNLQTIEVYGTNLTIPQHFVGGNSLTSVTLSGISSIGNTYGLDSGNANASTRVLTMLDTTPPEIGSSSISNYNPTVIYVPASAVNAYKAAGNWYYYRTKIQAIPT